MTTPYLEQTGVIAEDYRQPFERMRRQQLFDIAQKNNLLPPDGSGDLLTKGQLMKVVEGGAMRGALATATISKNNTVLPTLNVTAEEEEAERKAFRASLENMKTFSLNKVVSDLGLKRIITETKEQKINRIMAAVEGS